MDFENGESTSGWTLFPNWTITSDNAFSGSRSAYCTGQSPSTLSVTRTSANSGVVGFYFTANFGYNDINYAYLKL